MLQGGGLCARHAVEGLAAGVHLVIMWGVRKRAEFLYEVLDHPANIGEGIKTFPDSNCGLQAKPGPLYLPLARWVSSPLSHSSGWK